MGKYEQVWASSGAFGRVRYLNIFHIHTVPVYATFGHITIQTVIIDRIQLHSHILDHIRPTRLYFAILGHTKSYSAMVCRGADWNIIHTGNAILCAILIHTHTYLANNRPWLAILSHNLPYWTIPGIVPHIRPHTATLAKLEHTRLYQTVLAILGHS